MSSGLHSGLRAARVKAGLQQRELAARVGVSRQALSALEAGTTVPSTSLALQLARALGCRVEELFWLGDDEAPFEADLVGAGAGEDRRKRVAVAEVGERWVAHLLDGEGTGAAGTPADGLRAGRRVRPLRAASALRRNLLVAGCDPALGLLGGHLAERFPQARLHWVEAGSTAALEMLARGEVNLAGLHLYDEESGEFNVAAVRAKFDCIGNPGRVPEPSRDRHQPTPSARTRLGTPGRASSPAPYAIIARPMRVVTLAAWEEGLVVAPGNPRRLRHVADLAQRKVRVVGREPGSGAQQLLVRLLARAGLRPSAIDVVSQAHGHAALAAAVAAGAADTGIATRAAAVNHGLDFVPLAESRFDLVVPAAEDERLDRLLDVLAGRPFKRDLGSVVGYGTARTGRLVAEVAA
jgi:molybdopterin molybdotransferase/putative molybdopterin biosynthesis protein